MHLFAGDNQLQQATDNVKARYRRRGLVKSSAEQDPWPPFHAESFTSLALMHQKVKQLQAKMDATTAARIRTKGEIHKIPELTSSIKLDNIHQIFTPIASDNQCPMSILIEGHPGIGKTTLAKEICLQWANNELLSSDKLLLLLMLRDPNVQKITSTEELIRYTLSSDQVSSVLTYLHSSNGSGVTFIIDRFDELSNKLRRMSLFRKLIEGDSLPNARVVVTSRPSASACLHQFVHRRIEVLGFEKSSKEHYANESLKTFPSKLQTLKKHFQQYPNIDAICYIPLNMAIIVFLCLLGCLPPTATKMYENFILHTVCRHFKRIGKIAENEHISKIEDLPLPIHQTIRILEKVAFDGLLEDRIVFTIDDLPGMCIDDPTCFGLLQSVECYSSDEIGSSTKSFNFLHLGIQEYFAAKYVSTLPEDKVYNLLKESFIVENKSPDSKSVRLSNMWIMYCGITGGKCGSLQQYLSTYSKSEFPSVGSLSLSTPSLPINYQPLSSSLSIPGTLTTPDSCCSFETQPLNPLALSIIGNKITQPLLYHPRMFHQQKSADYQAELNHSHSNNIEHASTKINTLVTSETLAISLSSSSEEMANNSSDSALSQDILKNSVKVLYLFQCFQEAQDDTLCGTLSRSFNGGEIDVSDNKLLPHQVVSLGFFLSRSPENWKVK